MNRILARFSTCVCSISALLICLVFAPSIVQSAQHHQRTQVKFQTSDRCLACHNGLTTPSGTDVSIGFDWRASIMANSSRDPYWQASVRRESIDHPESQPSIEDECSACHMPVTRYEAKLRGRLGEIFAHLPFDADRKETREAEDGVTCSICHQIGKDKLGTRESFNGEFVIDEAKSKDEHSEYGPFEIQSGQKRIMQTSSGGFIQATGVHIRDSQLCATCHTLFTKARGPDGKVIGELPEQMPYLEWFNSDYRDKQSCQSCHMPEVSEDTPIAKVLGVPRPGLHRHVFVAANFFMLRMLNRYRDDLSVAALPDELNAASDSTVAFLQSKTARLSIDSVNLISGRLEAEVTVDNLTGHKLPTAFPSRRAWLHVSIRDRNHRTVFESGALNPDGSIQGNDNDSDPGRFEPHYSHINDSQQVEIYESIMKDRAGDVTTGLLSAVGYLKDNRVLPHGFKEDTAEKAIAVYGEAAQDPGFTGAGSHVKYSVFIGSAPGPFAVTVELWYQPIGYRWANNLKVYDNAEPRRFTTYYDSMSPSTAVILAQATAAK